MFSLKRPAAVLAGMSVLIGVMLTAAPSAQAQTDCLPRDPYTGAQPCHTAPVCTATVAIQGRERVVATGFAPGDQLTGSIDGHVVFVVDTTDGNLDVMFTLPALAAGSYGLAVAGSPSGQLCDPEFAVAGTGATVQGTSFTRPSGSSGAAGTSGVGPLARTGLGIMALLAAGLAALLAGYFLRRVSRRQHRRHPRHA